MKTESRGSTAAALPAGAAAPGEIELLPAGEIPTRPHDSRAPWHNPDAAAVAAATQKLGLDIAIDYDHQTERSAENGQPAPAAGWIRRVFARDGAVWGEVEWTDPAKAMIEAREYRFISPTFIYDKTSRVISRLVGAALTNNPAFFMRAIARADSTEEESEMDLKALAKALGLADTANEADILAAATAAASAQTALGTIGKALALAEDAAADAVATAVTALAKGRKAIAKAAGLSEDASAQDVETAVKTARASASAGDPDPSAFVPRAEFDRVQERLTTLETDTASASATAAVDRAIKDGKVTPASREWALGYAAKDPEGFTAFVEAAPKILSSGRVAPAGTPGEGGEALTDEERAVCRATGVSEKDFIASRKELAGETEETGNG